MDPYCILHLDEDILVADKLAPIPIQKEKSGDRSLQELLVAELQAQGQSGFLEATHRIDRRASGAVIFARTAKSLSTLDAAFRDHRIEKRYVACIERELDPPSGRLEHELLWDRRRNVVRACATPTAHSAPIPPPPDSPGSRGDRRPQHAILEYRSVGRSDRYFFVEISLITGRHHQIRAQLAAVGCPIRGDIKYGARRSAPSGLIMLHARSLSFGQPRTGERIEILAPFPESEPLWQAYAEQAAPPGASPGA